MNRMQNTTRLFVFLALALVLVVCSTPTVVVPPTQDIPAVRTESAKTVVAKITIEAALAPTATQTATSEPVVITATLAPTATQTPTALATATLIPTNKPVTSSGGSGAYPTATRRSGPDQAQLVSQEPIDGTDYNAGEDFDGKWTFKNIGTSTWTTGFEYRFAGGTNLANANIYPLSKDVKPGESISIIVDMEAPSDGGRYVSNWELVNLNGDVFYLFYVVIDVR